METPLCKRSIDFEFERLLLCMVMWSYDVPKDEFIEMHDKYVADTQDGKELKKHFATCDFCRSSCTTARICI